MHAVHVRPSNSWHSLHISTSAPSRPKMVPKKQQRIVLVQKRFSSSHTLVVDFFATPNLPSIRLFQNETTRFYLCLFAIILQATFASTFSKGGSLSSNKESGGPKPKKVVGKLLSNRKLSSSSNKSPTAMNKRVCSKGKSKDVVNKKNKPKFLTDLLPRELVELVIAYFNDDAYPITVSTHNWAFKGIVNGIAVDSARLYVLTEAEGIKSLSHPLANTKEGKCRLMEFGDSRWSNYCRFTSSHDGRCVSFNYLHKVLAGFGKQAGYSRKWLVQSGESEDGRPKHLTFDAEIYLTDCCHEMDRHSFLTIIR